LATYNIKFINNWNETDHGPLPNNAHWSKLVGVNHNANIEFVKNNGTASLGVKISLKMAQIQTSITL